MLGVLGYTRQMDFGVAIGYGRDGHPISGSPTPTPVSIGPNREVHIAFRPPTSTR